VTAAGRLATTLVAAIAALCALAPRVASAHEFTPSFYELTEEGSGTFEVVWRPGTVLTTSASAASDPTDTVEPVLPEGCAVSPLTAGHRDGIERVWRIYCGEQGLAGRTIAVSGLDRHRADVLTRIQWADGSERVEILSGALRSLTLPAGADAERAASGAQVFGTYLRLGAEHIAMGIDHLLFVLLLVLIVTDGRRLVATVTGFTIGHSVTLVGATLGWFAVPIGPIEALIALSVLLLAAEAADPNALTRRGQIRRHPWAVAGLFGLLHGFGFSSALHEVGLPSHAVPFALAAFNVGVELGQLAFVAVLLVLGQTWRKLVGDFPRVALPATAVVVGSLAAFWFFERSWAVFTG
jgi:hydrogenase/urease accessory protein HupE